MFAWIFSADTLPDGSPLPGFGEVRTVRPPVVLHKSGLHAHFDAFDALAVGRGNLLCFVKAEGVVQVGRGVVASSAQRYLNCVDAGDLLAEFSRFCCRQGEPLWRPSAAVRDWLATGDVSLMETARLDAQSAVQKLDRRDLGRTVARTVVQAAGGLEPWLVAQAACYNVPWALASGGEGAAWTAARDAAESMQRDEFNRLVGVALSLDLRRVM